jgi:gliding motility-associated-like protein
MCYTLPGLQLSGGTPAGGVYYLNGIQTDSIYPYKMAEGVYPVSYHYTAPTGCSNSDSAKLRLYSDPSCEGTVFFPNAFTPGNDSVNNLFRPVVKNIYSFTMHIYSRWGQLIYTTNDVAAGWNGKLNGADSPIGLYTFEATYAPSLRTDEFRTRRGVFSLIR